MNPDSLILKKPYYYIKPWGGRGLANNKTAALVEKMTAPVIETLGYDLVDVEYTKEGSRYILRFFIDKPGGINHDDCELVSGEVGTLLDEEDPIPNAYYLEVSSPGLERPLKKNSDFLRYKGYMIKVTTFAPIEGKKKIIGKLAGLVDGNIVLEDKDKTLSIPLEQIASARLHVDF